jgi:hypothetical protein
MKKEKTSKTKVKLKERLLQSQVRTIDRLVRGANGHFLIRQKVDCSVTAQMMDRMKPWRSRSSAERTKTRMTSW